MSQRPRLAWVRRRGALLIGAFLALDAAVAAVACSSSTVAPFDEADATPDGAASKDGGVDSPTSNPDTGPQSGGHCAPDGSPVTSSPCDVVLQDCPKDSKGNTQECLVVGTASECVAVTASEQLPIGRACCSNNPTGNPCRPGLSCIGTPCTDAGPNAGLITGRCSPACCDDKICGKSDPEGTAGSCDITIVDDKDVPLYQACTYRERCLPFLVEPCKNGQGCEIDDNQGTSTCIDTSGKTDHQSCSFKNDCADGFICLGGATSICRMMCHVPNTVTPFDAGGLTTAPGHGGCPAGQACTLFFNQADAPAWLGACALPDGG